MPQIDLATLPADELRQLLDSARRCGLAKQSYEILQEMEARRTRGEPAPLKRSRRRRAPDSRVIVLELGDPLDSRADADAESVNAGDEPPLTLGEPSLPQQAPPPPARDRQRWGHWATLCFAVGLGGGVAAGWWAADGGQWRRPALPRPSLAAQQPARAPLPVVVAAAPEVSAPPTTPITPAEAATPVTTAATAQQSLDPAAATPQMASAAPAPASARPEVGSDEDRNATTTAGEASQHALAAEARACSAEATAADRTICSEPGLRRLQAELRQAYATALAAHEDRALLRQRELAWRDARNAVSDPDQLAGLYRQRIAQLKAAAADAERQRASAAHRPRPRQASTAGHSFGA